MTARRTLKDKIETGERDRLDKAVPVSVDPLSSGLTPPHSLSVNATSKCLSLILTRRQSSQGKDLCSSLNDLLRWDDHSCVRRVRMVC
jgi:hypothetical protein